MGTEKRIKEKAKNEGQLEQRKYHMMVLTLLQVSRSICI